MWHSLNRKIISTINVKMITLINLVQKDISSSFLKKSTPTGLELKKKNFVSWKLCLTT